MRIVWIMMLLAIYSQASAEIYKWVDQQGVTHYSEKPPANGKVKKIQLKSESAADMTEKSAVEKPTNNRSRLEKQQKLLRALSDDRQQEKEQRQKAERMAKQRIRNCAMSKDNLRRYESSSAVYKVDDQGKRIMLPSSERDKSIQRARAEVNKWCGN